MTLDAVFNRILVVDPDVEALAATCSLLEAEKKIRVEGASDAKTAIYQQDLGPHRVGAGIPTIPRLVAAVQGAVTSSAAFTGGARYRGQQSAPAFQGVVGFGQDNPAVSVFRPF
jgi:hypothetical protein